MGHATISTVAQAASAGHSMKHQVSDQAVTEAATDKQSKSIKVSKCALCALCCGVALLPDVPTVLPLVSPLNFVPVGSLLATAEFLTSGLERPPRSLLA
jgi:di/tricarboxylate transporter